MTGESEERKKESLEQCLEKQEEKNRENNFGGKDEDKGAHDLPSPILLSGTDLLSGEGLFISVVVGKNSCLG